MSCNCQWFFIFTYRLKILLCSFCSRVSPINFNGLWRFEGFLFWLGISLKLRVNSYLFRCFFNYLLDWFCLLIIIDIEYFLANIFFQRISIALFDSVRRLFFDITAILLIFRPLFGWDTAFCCFFLLGLKLIRLNVFSFWYFRRHLILGEQFIDLKVKKNMFDFYLGYFVEVCCVRVVLYLISI